MASFFKVGSNILSSIAQTIQEHISDNTTNDEQIISNYPTDINYIQNGGRGTLVFHLLSENTLTHHHHHHHDKHKSSGNGHGHGSIFQDGFELEKILHLNYEKNLMMIYKLSPPSSSHSSSSPPPIPSTSSSTSSSSSASVNRNENTDKYSLQYYLCSKISSIKRLNVTCIQIDMQSSMRQPLILNFKNEPDSNQFLKFLVNLYFYSDVILNAYQELLLEETNSITMNGLLQSYQRNNIPITQENIQSIFNLSPANLLDYISFFELLLDLPVYNTFDCLVGLLSRIGLNDLSFTPYNEPLLLGEVIVKHIPHTRWFYSHSDLDINSYHQVTDRLAWYGSLLFTNYRLILYCYQKSTYLHSKTPLPTYFNKLSIPLNSISKVILSSEPSSLTHQIRYNIVTKDNKLIRLILIKDVSYTQAVVFHRQLLNGIYLSSPQRMFCFHYQQVFTTNGWKYSNIRYDYERLGLLSDSEWTTINNLRGELIETYPSLLLVPSSISKEMIQNCISFRSLGRFPIVTYRHNETQCCLSRSAQPVSSQSQACIESDRELLNAYRTSGVFNQLREANANRLNSTQSSSSSPLLPSPPVFYIVDARGWLAIAANVAGGKGTEDISCYINCQLILCDIDNIHGMRNSFNSFSSAIYSHAGITSPTTTVTSISSTTSSLTIPEEGLLKKIDQSGWLNHCSRLLSASVFVAEKLHHEKSSVLVHCSDGWDRTAQITSLSQILLDPFYRTIEGLAVLIEKEWCAFGHKFQIRCGHSDTPDSPLADQKSPIFFQFLHILHALLEQFPTTFEFSDTLLIFLSDHLLSGLFGNFLGNSDKERRYNLMVEEKTQSIWSYVMEEKMKFINSSYEMVKHPIWPYCGVSKIPIWERHMMRWNPYSHPKSNNSNDHWKDDLGDGFIHISETIKRDGEQKGDREEVNEQLDGFL